MGYRLGKSKIFKELRGPSTKDREIAIFSMEVEIVSVLLCKNIC